MCFVTNNCNNKNLKYCRNDYFIWRVALKYRKVLCVEFIDIRVRGDLLKE